jgi:hypothetical protein
MDDWLASLSVSQFECILNALMDGLGNDRQVLDRTA